MPGLLLDLLLCCLVVALFWVFVTLLFVVIACAGLICLTCWFVLRVVLGGYGLLVLFAVKWCCDLAGIVCSDVVSLL